MLSHSTHTPPQLKTSAKTHIKRTEGMLQGLRSLKGPEWRQKWNSNRFPSHGSIRTIERGNKTREISPLLPSSVTTKIPAAQALTAGSIHSLRFSLQRRAILLRPTLCMGVSMATKHLGGKKKSRKENERDNIFFLKCFKFMQERTSQSSITVLVYG